jgi:hypothetical protein
MKSALALLLVAVIGVTVMAQGEGDKPKMKPPATSPGFESLKKLAGEWSGPGPDGKTATTRFRVSAGGSIVHETLFPGTPEEMVTVYHMDGKDLVLTHYCMLGNQPRLKADDPSDAKNLSFKSVGGTNMKMEDMHMGRAVITFVDADHFEANWCGCTGGKVDESHCFSAKFTRKKAS